MNTLNTITWRMEPNGLIKGSVAGIPAFFVYGDVTSRAFPFILHHTLPKTCGFISFRTLQAAQRQAQKILTLNQQATGEHNVA